MSIKTNELPFAESVKGSDSIVSDTADYGTARVKYDDAAEFMKNFFLGGGVPYGKELKDSWATLAERIKKGDFDGIHIGDYKTITVGSDTVVMEVAGIDHYYKCCDQQVGHHIDFISRDCLSTEYKMRDENTNNGTKTEPNPFRASALFTTLNTTIFNQLPKELQGVITEKRALLESRYSESSQQLTADTGWAWNSMGKLWLPTEVEVFGNTFWSDGDAGWTGGGGCNLQYPIFYGGTKHIIKGKGNGGVRVYWWESSVRGQSSTNFCIVDSYGDAGGLAATQTGLFVPVCFRIS